MQIEMWPVSRLVPYGRNPRKNDQAVERMMASIQEFTFKVPMLVCSNGEVVDGHLRLKAAQKLGLETVPVILCDEWSEAQIKAFRLMVNRSGNWAEWDLDLVALEMEDLKALHYDIQLTGFDPVEIDGLLFGNSDTEANEVIVEPPQSRLHGLATYGSSAHIECCVAMPFRQTRLPFCSVPVNRC